MAKKQKRQVKQIGKKNISAEITRKIGKPTCIIFVFVAVIMSFLVQQQVSTAKQTELSLESEAAGNQLNAFFQEYLRAVEQLAVNPEVIAAMKEANASNPIDQVKSVETVLDNMVAMQKADADNVMAVWIGDIDANRLTQSDGYTSGDDFDLSSREYYQVVETGKSMLTKPYVDKSTGNVIVSAAAPVYDPSSGEAIGVTGLDLSLEHVGDILSQCTIGKKGYVIMTASDGTIIYHPNDSLLQQVIGDLNISDNVPNAITNQQEKFMKYKIDGSTKYGYVMGVGDTGYYVLSNMPSGEYSQNLVIIICIMIIIFALGIAVIFFAIRKVAGQLTKPIEELNVAAQELAAGNLNVELKITSEDEIGELGRSIEKTVSRLKTYIAYIDEVSAVLAQMAEGRLVISLENDYAGDFAKIKDALLNISASMTEVLTSITESAEQVSSGADDLAGASQVLAEGAGTQAAAVEELVATTESIVLQVEENKQEAQNSAQETRIVTQLAESSKNQMADMLVAMQTISETSNQVVGIIHTIEEIADQTNLLSLNASIEAARAGEAGKGFAVVATEIGGLANESAEAANTTKEMIEISMHEIEKGVALANQVTDTLQAVVNGIEQVNGMIDHTAELSIEQADNMEQIKGGIESISSSVQDTSATAEESSATSQELAAQATLLTDMVRKFELN